MLLNETLPLTVHLFSAYVSNHPVEKEEIVPLLGRIFSSLSNFSRNPEMPKKSPVVPIEDSVTDAYLICLEDGKKLQMLKRHLWSKYQLSIEDYKKRWGLPDTYPSVAANYAQKRSAIAKGLGLGKTGRRPARLKEVRN